MGRSEPENTHATPPIHLVMQIQQKLIARHTRLLFLVVCSLACVSVPVLAQDVTEGVAEDNSLRTTPDKIPDTDAGKEFRWLLEWLGSDFEEESVSHFHESFLAAVPPAQLRVAHAQIGGLFREPAQPQILRVQSHNENALEAFIRETQSDTVVKVGFTIDPIDKRITGFLVQPAPAFGDRAESWEALTDRLKELSGTTSVGAWQLTNGRLRPVFEHGADNRLAIGSTFKLYILGALSKLIAQDKAAWDEKLAITEDLKSLPSGTMQNEAAGSEFTLLHFATLMISISDNTATDHLLHRVGRERVEQHMATLHADPSRNLPFLTTQEMFKVKLSGDPELPAAYGGADEKARRAMLADGGRVANAKADLSLASMWLVPIEIERVEWFATAEECADSMVALWKLSKQDGLGPIVGVLSANPGIPIDQEIWQQILFKGGSEPGVINLTWLLEHADGRVFVLSLGWNNPEALVNQDVIIERAFDALHLLQGG